MYGGVVTFDTELADLVPGMSAVAEIEFAQLKNVLTVPVEAVVREQGETWCHVKSANGVERRLVAIVASSDDSFQVLTGVAEGDRVVLKPKVTAP